MGITATQLTVRRYRSFESYRLELDPRVTVLVGRNAAGKTNLVEALQLLTAAQSFRRPSAADLMKDGRGPTSMELTLEGDGRRLDMACEVVEGRRSFRRNGKKTRAAGIRGQLPSVLFCPDHLDMIKRSASVRRAALDDFGVQLNANYAKLVQAYERTVEQRNNLLKDPYADQTMLAVWDDALVANGAALMDRRLALLDRVRERFVAVYGAIAPGERADIAYEATIGPVAAVARADIATRFAAALEQVRDDERRRGITLAGPHRDEILFTIDGRPARDFGSQGQQRSLVLAWKIAEVQVTRDILGCYPLLLLDDVMSELDERRRDAVVKFVADDVQTVITTANLGYFSSEILDRAKVVHVDGEE